MLPPGLKAIGTACVDTAGPFSLPESIGQATCPGNQTVTSLPLPHTQSSAAGRAASVQPCLDAFVPEGIRPLKNVSLLCPEVMPSWRLGCCLPPMLLSERGVQVPFACPFLTHVPLDCTAQF